MLRPRYLNARICTITLHANALCEGGKRMRAITNIIYLQLLLELASINVSMRGTLDN